MIQLAREVTENILWERGPRVADPCPLSQTLSPNPLRYFKRIEAIGFNYLKA
jgi:hypothetical protein